MGKTKEAAEAAFALDMEKERKDFSEELMRFPNDPDTDDSMDGDWADDEEE